MSLLRAVATVGGLTLVSRVLGFTRDILIAALLGAGMVADCFFVAFKLPNFFRRLFAEGAFNSAFVPLFAEQLAGDDGKEAARKFAEESFSALALTLLLFVSVMQLAMPGVIFVLASGFADDPEKFDLAVTLSRITFPYLLFISLVSLLGGVLNSLEKFASVAATPILLNITLIAALLLLTPYVPNGGHALAWGVSVAGLLQFVWLWFASARAGMTLRLKRPRLTPGVKKLLIQIAPIAIGAGAVQINLIIDIMIASWLPEGSISYLFYADRLNQLPIGVIGVALGTALLPRLSRRLTRGEDDIAMHDMNRGIELGLFFTLPCMGAFLVMAGPIVSVLFERGAFDAAASAATTGALIAYSAGLPAYVLVKVLAPGFFARQDTKTPVRYGIVALVVNTTLGISLAFPLQHVGLALAMAISAWLNVTLLWLGLRRRDQLQLDARLKQSLWRTMVSTLVMATGLWAGLQLLTPWFVQSGGMRFAALGLLVLGGGIVYFAAAGALGILRWRELAGLFQRSAGAS